MAVKWWAGEVVDTAVETPRVSTLTVAVTGWASHRAGQHVDVRLTAEDGYQAVRSYSIASPPGTDERIAITVERLADGEVSAYLVDEVRPGDPLELLGPIGGYFVWDASTGGPLLLIGAGSGIVPLMAILRHRAAVRVDVPARLLASFRSEDEIIYREELDERARKDPNLGVTFTLTREQPPGWTGYARRVDAAMVAEVAWTPEQ